MRIKSRLDKGSSAPIMQWQRTGPCRTSVLQSRSKLHASAKPRGEARSRARLQCNEQSKLAGEGNNSSNPSAQVLIPGGNLRGGVNVFRGGGVFFVC